MNTSDLFHTIIFALFAFLLLVLTLGKPLVLIAFALVLVVAAVMFVQLTIGLLIVVSLGYILKGTK